MVSSASANKEWEKISRFLDHESAARVIKGGRKAEHNLLQTTMMPVYPQSRASIMQHTRATIVFEIRRVKVKQLPQLDGNNEKENKRKFEKLRNNFVNRMWRHGHSQCRRSRTAVRLKTRRGTQTDTDEGDKSRWNTKAIFLDSTVPNQKNLSAESSR